MKHGPRAWTSRFIPRAAAIDSLKAPPETPAKHADVSGGALNHLRNCDTLNRVRYILKDPDKK